MRFRRRPKDEPQAVPATEQPTVPIDAPAAPVRAGDPAPVAERSLDGLRAWIAQVDRKLGVRTYAGAAAVVLALAAGLVGAYLGASAKDDSATKGEVESLRDQLEAVQAEAQSAADEGVQSVEQRLADLESRLDTLSTSLQTTQNQLSQIQQDASAPGPGPGGGADSGADNPGADNPGADNPGANNP